mmetsp:Transcript_75236/g.200863  ORF Transcript_75236/g.200863 Transcript_75236/m.200863 type:complete len:221 (-) Transcript_75236:898-1560(-)
MAFHVRPTFRLDDSMQGAYYLLAVAGPFQGGGVHHDSAPVTREALAGVPVKGGERRTGGPRARPAIVPCSTPSDRPRVRRITGAAPRPTRAGGVLWALDASALPSIGTVIHQDEGARCSGVARAMRLAVAGFGLVTPRRVAAARASEDKARPVGLTLVIPAPQAGDTVGSTAAPGNLRHRLSAIGAGGQPAGLQILRSAGLRQGGAVVARAVAFLASFPK